MDYTDYANDALEASRSAWVHWRDSDVGVTHTPILGGDADDLFATSNRRWVLDELSHHVDTGDIDEGFVSKSGYPWVSFLLVRVLDDDGEITDAWREVVDEVLRPLEDYPLLDEDGYCELERERFWDHLTSEVDSEALQRALEEHIEDTHDVDLDGAAIALALFHYESNDWRLDENELHNLHALTELAERLASAYANDTAHKLAEYITGWVLNTTEHDRLVPGKGQTALFAGVDHA